MKLQYVGLAGVGVVAALAASVLVARVQAGMGGKEAEQDSEVHVLIAARPLQAVTTLTADCFTVAKVRKSDAPKESYSDPVQVVGKVLAAPMVEGQAFTPSSFAGDGTGAHMAANIPAGMRAMNVALDDYQVLDGLLYPGSSVDVIASFDLRNRGERSQGVISKTILRGIQVLAVENRTTAVQSNKTEEEDAKVKRAGDRRSRVTLLVNETQAQTLQLAMDNGVVTLALRNPQDETEGTEQIIRLADLGVQLEDPWSPESVETLSRAADTTPAAAGPVADQQPPATTPASVPVPRIWTTVVLKGGSPSTLSFPLPAERK